MCHSCECLNKYIHMPVFKRSVILSRYPADSAEELPSIIRMVIASL